MKISVQTVNNGIGQLPSLLSKGAVFIEVKRLGARYTPIFVKMEHDKGEMLPGFFKIERLQLKKSGVNIINFEAFIGIIFINGNDQPFLLLQQKKALLKCFFDIPASAINGNSFDFVNEWHHNGCRNCGF